MLYFISEKELRIIMIGTVKSGKSTTGNAILGTQKFQTKLSGTAVTRESTRKQIAKDNKTIIIVDTPGFFNMDNPGHVESVVGCIKNGIHQLSPRVHAIVLVVSMIGFSNTDIKLLEYLSTKQEGMKNFMILVFTGRDLLEKGKNDFETFKAELPLAFQDFMIKFVSGRIFAVDNVSSKSDIQISKLLKLIEEMSRPTQEPGYTIS